MFSLCLLLLVLTLTTMSIHVSLPGVPLKFLELLVNPESCEAGVHNIGT